MTLPLPLTHSWPLVECDQRFDLKRMSDVPAETACNPERLGTWSCDLLDNALTWSDPVFDLFGLPRGAALRRDEMVALYEEGSRAAMERLRAYAIRHRRGFTLDAQIVPVSGTRRWMRLVAAPVFVGPRAVRLRGVKLDVTSLYAR